MLVGVATALTFSGVGFAMQNASGGTGATPPATEAGAEGENQPAATAVANEIVLSIDRFGVGNQARAGDWAAVQIAVVDSNVKQRDVILSLAIPDADGDIATFARVVTLNPGAKQKFWMYIRVPFSALGTNLAGMLEAHEAIASDAEPILKNRPGRLLGQTPIGGGTIRVLESTVGLAAVLGPRSAGLRAYADRDSPSQTHLTLGHEVTEIVEGLTAIDLPDRWQGLAAFETIVWIGADIGELRGETARALREWVRRGGHLIVSLPSVGAAWTTPSSNELLDIMPAVKVSRREDVDLDTFRQLITSTDAPLPRKAVVHDLIPREDAGPAEAIRLLSGPDGRCAVARRLVDSGMVTLIGLDLSARQLADRIDADMFWNRILGKRCSIVPAAEKAGVSQNMNRPSLTLDAGVHEVIAKKGQTAAAVLLGLVVFAAYWLAAGPLGYAVLKKTRRVRHAWLAYVLTAGFFTALAWSGATALRPRKVEAAHVTVLQHVYGQPQSRARTWASILTPGYGTATIQIGGPNGKIEETSDQRASGNIATAWDVPNSDGPRTQFPDARAYIVDARNPSEWRVPSRATVKQFQFEWSGGPRWTMPHPVAPEGQTERDGLRVIRDIPQGTLVHNLPGELRDVVIMYVSGQSEVLGTSQGKFAAPVRALGLAVKTPSWPAGQGLDLAGVFDKTPRPLLSKYLDLLIEKPSEMNAIAQSALPTPRLIDQVAAMAFYGVLPTPGYPLAGQTESHVSVQRVLTHGWDLARWTTQPCLIIVGVLGGDGPEGAVSPTPVFVDGQEIQMRGKTIVHWVYPLADNPPLMIPKAKAPTAASGSVPASL